VRIAVEPILSSSDFQLRTSNLAFLSATLFASCIKLYEKGSRFLPVYRMGLLK